MPNLFKHFMAPKAVPYQLPDALELEVTEEEDFIPLGEEGFASDRRQKKNRRKKTRCNMPRCRRI